jgi:hypothetical protein
VDTHLILLPKELPPGEYRLHVGLYLLQTGERLDVIDAEPPASAVILSPIHIRTDTTGGN